jgi:hypothetical protein
MTIPEMHIQSVILLNAADNDVTTHAEKGLTYRLMQRLPVDSWAIDLLTHLHPDTASRMDVASILGITGRDIDIILNGSDIDLNNLIARIDR